MRLRVLFFSQAPFFFALPRTAVTVASTGDVEPLLVPNLTRVLIQTVERRESLAVLIAGRVNHTIHIFRIKLLCPNPSESQAGTAVRCPLALSQSILALQK